MKKLGIFYGRVVINISTRIFALSHVVMVNGFIERLIGAFKEWLSFRLPDCKAITPAVSESFDRRIGWWKKAKIKLHLFACDRCERYLQQLKFMHATLKGQGGKIADPENTGGALELRKESKSRLKHLLTCEDLR